MANVKISALPAATLPLAGTEELPLVQSTATKKVTVDSINANATLQQVTAGFNKDLTNDRNLQGTDAGNNNTGDRVNAFGNGALKDNTGDDVNAFGSSTGEGNAFNSVNFFGHGTSADADQQAVFGNYDGTTTFNARLSYKDISDDRKYELPDASGTLVLSVNGNAPDAQGDVTVSVSAPYAVYTATLTQAGTAAPVANVLQNTLGGTVVWARIGVGAYTATLNGAFILNKTVCFVNTAISNTQLQAYRSNDDAVELDQQNFSNVAIDGLFSNCIEIRVYP